MTTSPQPKTFAALRNRMFRILWLSSVVSNTGGMIQLVGAAWLMTLLTTSESMVALVQASVALPVTLVSIAAGVLADNYERRSVMLCSQILMLTVSVILAALAIAGLVTPWLLLSLTFLIGVGTAIHNPSWQASFTDLVPREDLPSATTMNAMGMNITRSVGPTIGGVVVAALGSATAFAINAGSYLVMIGALLAWHPKRVEQPLPRERFHNALGAGTRYLLLSPNIMRINVRGMLFGFAAISMQALLPLVARNTLAANAVVYGILVGSFGVGAVVGALSASKIRSHLSVESICRGSFLIFAAGCIVVAYSRNVGVTGMAIFVSGAAWININSLLNVVVQMSSPRWVLGRMIALFMTFIFGGMALGSWTWGAVSETYGLQTAFLFAAAVLVVGFLWGLRFPIQPYGDLNLSPLNRSIEASIRLDLNRRSGPILIMVEYDVAQENVTEFLAAMAAWRRIRLRDGARQWSLLRDLEMPDLWIESYHLPTWTDYLRHVERRTMADGEVLARLSAVNRGRFPLRVRRMIERQTVVPHDDTPLVIRPEAIQ
jgi:MFS family permease